MPVNQQPIFTRQGDVSSNAGIVVTANMGPTVITATADYTGVSTNHMLVFTADATNGSFIQRLRFKAEGGTTTATCARIYINNGGDPTLAQNNAFYGECALPLVTAINTAATSDLEYAMNIMLNPGFRIYVGLAATTSAAGWNVTPVAGSY